MAKKKGIAAFNLNIKPIGEHRIFKKPVFRVTTKIGRKKSEITDFIGIENLGKFLTDQLG